MSNKIPIPKITIILLFFLLCPAFASKDGGKLKFYGYSNKQIQNFLLKKGYTIKSLGAITRSTEGKALNLYFWKKNKALVISCSGRITEIKLKGIRSVVDDSLSIGAFSAGGVVYLSNGKSYEGVMNALTFDSSAKYFIYNPIDFRDYKGITKVYEITNTSTPIIQAPIISTTARIFKEGKNLILIGNDFVEPKKYLKIYIYRKKNGFYIKEEQYDISRPSKAESPFSVIDYSPEDKKIVILDSRDFPGISKWYLYDMQKRVLELIGPASDYGFFLKCDALSG